MGLKARRGAAGSFLAALRRAGPCCPAPQHTAPNQSHCFRPAPAKSLLSPCSRLAPAVLFLNGRWTACRCLRRWPSSWPPTRRWTSPTPSSCDGACVRGARPQCRSPHVGSGQCWDFSSVSLCKRQSDWRVAIWAACFRLGAARLPRRKPHPSAGGCCWEFAVLTRMPRCDCLL